MISPFRNLVIRSSPASRRLVVCKTCLAAQLSPYKSRYSTQTAKSRSGLMFAKANQNYKANKPAPQQYAGKRHGLAKQLFPSSSPSSSPGNIRDQLKCHGPSRFQAFSPSKGRQNVQQTVMADDKLVTDKPTASSGGIGRGSLASLYDKSSSSFHPPVIDLTVSSTEVPDTTAVFFGEDDFSDDDNLDLDFKAPTALPPSKSEPISIISTPKKIIPPNTPMMLPPSTNSEMPIPWSSSPASHFLPPQQKHIHSQSSGGNNTSLKREALSENNDDCLEISVQKKPTKRAIPPSWRCDNALEEEQISQDIETPAVKTEARDIWDPTASTVKEQKKQLKNQQSAKRGETEAQTIKPHVPPETTSKIPRMAAISLSSEQNHVVDLVVEKRQSVFFTGPAGTGKSVLMRSIIEQLKAKYRDQELVAVTASTGLAACNIGGVTLHSFSGIGLGKDNASNLIKKVRRNPKAKNRWLKTKVLIIDEISMVDGDLFDKLSQIGRTIRNDGRPWGGIQLVITGDFFQLPPVPDNKEQAKFAFDAATWSTSIDHTIGLTQVFRQRDPEFARMLNEMRLGKITSETITAFKALERPLMFDDGVDSAELFPLRSQVEGSNVKRLRDLPGKVYRFDAADTGDPAIKDRLLANMMAPKTIELKMDAQVMLIKNLDSTLVNGSLGRVIGFSDEATVGMNGQERSGTLSEKDDGTSSKAKIAQFYKAQQPKSGSKKLFPLVQFISVSGTPRVILCQPEEWKVELPNGEVQAKRTQLPLILAWALSIHKAQGQTLERVTVNLGRVFEKGQAYVALSRATSQAGLRVIGFDKDKVMAHPKVVEFYNKLYSAAEAMKFKPNSILDFVAARRGR